MNDRLENERAFHNRRFGQEDQREGLNKWYLAVAAGTARMNELIRKWGRGKTVLEYGCATGELSLVEQKFPQTMRKFHGIDISDAGIERARDLAKEHAYTNCKFDTMNAESMTFPDCTFDLVFGRGIIHHLDLTSAFAEVSRVLKPQGKAIFYEPMGHNALLNWYRNRTPNLRTVDEHPILEQDFDLAARYFSRIDRQEFGLTTLAAVPFYKTVLGKPVMATLGMFDQLLFMVPFFRKNAWHTLMVLTK